MTLAPPPAQVGDGPLELIRFIGLEPGPRLIVTGAVHGNETCGPNAIARVHADLRAGRLALARGEVTFLPICNRRAYRQGTREGTRNLNRDLRDKPVPQDYEDRIGNALCRLLRAHDVLLDVHSFKGEGPPFVFFGPDDNRGPLEPFARAGAEAALAACLGVEVAMHGWLPAYEKLHAGRARLGLPALGPTEGHGTTEYMRFAGGYGVTLECGRHDDPASVDVGERAIRAALAQLGLIDAPAPAPSVRRLIRLDDVILRESAGDRLEGEWKTGDAVAAGAVFARRADGSAVAAPRDGFLVFPDPSAEIGKGLTYLAVASKRAIPGCGAC